MAPGAGGGAVPSRPAVDVLLAAALRSQVIDSEGEARAVAAFLAAREQSLQVARTRRRDDWRPREERGSGRSLRATFAVLLASVTLGGVAVASIGVSSDGDGHGSTGPSSSAPDRPEATPSDSTGSTSSGPGASSSDAPSDRPSQAEDVEAQCRAYELVEGRGQALDATAWQRLVDAADGEANVDAYCAEQLSESQDQRQGESQDQDHADVSPGPSAADGAGDTAASGRAVTPTPGKSPGKK